MLRINFKFLAGMPRKGLSVLGICANVRSMERMLTAKDIAKRFGVSNSTARGWLLRGRFAGAELRESELGQPYWVAPESSVDNFTPPKPGPVPKVQAPPAPPTRRSTRKKPEAKP
jgi:hypothetical protein